MARIIVCITHQALGYPREIEATPTAFDMPGALSCDHPPVPVFGTPEAEHLDCKTGCRWASDPAADFLSTDGLVGPDLSHLPTSPSVAAVESLLGSVGDPTLPRKLKKEKNMPKAKTETQPQKREHRRGIPIVTRKFGSNIEVQVLLKAGTVGDVLALTDADRTALFALLESVKAQPGGE